MTDFRKKQTHVSMQNVADYAKVSKGTVSKVLNNRSDVSEKAKVKVLAACEQLEYFLNPNVQDLLRKGVSGHSQDLSFVLVGAEFANPSYSGMIDGIAQRAEKHNFHLILSKLSGNEESIYNLPPAIRDQRVAGIVISGLLNEKIILLIRKTGIPYVVVGNYPKCITAFSNSVELDVGNLMHLAILELKAKNKTKTALFYEDPDNFYSQICFNEFKNALANNGMTFIPELVYEGKSGDFNAFNTMEKVFSASFPVFDSIICLNFSAAQEISCQIIANFGRDEASKIIITTLTNFTKRLPISTILYEEVSAKLASIGFDLLVEKLKNSDIENKHILSTPNIKTIILDD